MLEETNVRLKKTVQALETALLKVKNESEPVKRQPANPYYKKVQHLATLMKRQAKVKGESPEAMTLYREVKSLVGELMSNPSKAIDALIRV